MSRNRSAPFNIRSLLTVLPQAQQEVLKASARKLRRRVVLMVHAYGADRLEQALRDLGVAAGDAICMQSSLDTLNGFGGEAYEIIDRVLRIIGPQGHLFMVSMPYSGSAADYLAGQNLFDVRRTASQMGLISETFRRRAGVLRSGNPLHPVLAYGPRAKWVVEGHEDLSHSCGSGSLFEKMLALDTKELLFDVDLNVLTFAHYLEHTFQGSAPVRVYEPIAVRIKDRNGEYRTVSVYPFAKEAMKLRCPVWRGSSSEARFVSACWEYTAEVGTFK